MVAAMNPGVASVTDANAAQALASALQLHPLVARVLVRRGFTRPDATRSFLSPKLAELTRPEGMADRDAAAERLADAVRRKQRVVVFGDYDVDGITSAALITRALRAMGGDVSCLVASRFDGGYGLSDAALDRALALSPAVLVTCDCGTSDHPRLERARRLGVDAIVIDHHKVPEEALPAVAFLNPHRADCRFPYKHMASVGLAFSVAAAVRARLGVALDLREYLDLVALGTIADVAPLDGDNRTLTRHGLERIADGHGGPGVRALLAESKLRFRLVARDVAFSLAPMLNAPGRLGPATPTLELLLSESDRDAQPRAFALAQANLRRREISAQLVDAALAQAVALHGDKPPAGVVVAGDGWHAGMGGIVAGRLVERLQAAVCVIAVEGDLGVGSVRAPRGTKLYDAVYACRDLLEGFGGHDAAAGVRIRPGRIAAFREAFAEAVARSGGTPEPERAPEVELTEADLTATLARDLRALEPTGEGNPEVIVALRGARLGETRPIGEQHLRVAFMAGRRAVPGFFREGVAARARGELPAAQSRVDVVGALRTDPWSGPDAVQLDVRSISPAR
jgi:single-stranded-DNA-specific exonuclease